MVSASARIVGFLLFLYRIHVRRLKISQANPRLQEKRNPVWSRNFHRTPALALSSCEKIPYEAKSWALWSHDTNSVVGNLVWSFYCHGAYIKKNLLLTDGQSLAHQPTNDNHSPRITVFTNRILSVYNWKKGHIAQRGVFFFPRWIFSPIFFVPSHSRSSPRST